MKKALDNIFKARQLVKDMVISEKVVDVREIYDLLNVVIEDMTNRPHFYVQYCDDGPSGFCGQSMDITCEWNKIVLLDEEPDDDGMIKLLKAISVGRKNPRFGESWYDSGYYPGNNVIDMRRREEEGISLL